MTSGHLIFIPAVLVIGMFVGFLLGTRAAQDRINVELKRQAEREEARKARAERKAARQKGEGGASSEEGEGAKAE
ncbi:MAG TPA: hypothetical protein VIG06_11125 [Kofleriaceae bacterium]|jgi:hypothetical protein